MALPLPELAGTTHRTVTLPSSDGDGLAVHVAEAGPPDAPPLVLLHGWPQHWWCWRRVVPLLADRYRLVLPDLRGHGWSAAPDTGYDKEQLATDLLGLLDVLELPRAGLIGHDWGAWSGFLACLRRPDRFDRFLALGVPHPFQRPDARLLQAWRGGYQLVLGAPVLGERLLRDVPRAVEQLIRAGSTQREAFTPSDLRAYSAVLRSPERARASSRLYRTFVLQEAAPVWAGRYRAEDLQVPTRLVVGADDLVAAPALLAGWGAVPAARGLVRLPRVGHFVPEEAPQAVVEAWEALQSSS